MAYIEFNDVCKIYKSGDNEIYALDRMTFSVEKGELCVMVGPSGAGKPPSSISSAEWTARPAERSNSTEES